MLLQLKDKGVKFIIDYDDVVWKELPSYNKCVVHQDTNYKGMKEYLALLADKVTCTNEFIKESLSEFIDPSKIEIIPNALSKVIFLFSSARFFSKTFLMLVFNSKT